MGNKKSYLLGVIVIILMTIIVISYNLTANSNDDNDLNIYIFNAGKADAIILSKNNHHMMIDTGEENLSDDILRYFEANEIKKLDYLILTHFDKDHIGSASKIIDSLEIGEIYQSNSYKDSEYYDNYLISLEERGIKPVTVIDDINLILSNVEIVVNGPGKIYDTNESNNSSLIVSVKDNENKFLFMGDAENSRIKDFLKNNNETYDFLKVPYHGHYLKRLDDLLNNKNIKYSVITSSDEELEDNETIEILNKYNVKNYLTRDGSVSIISDGKNIIIKQ